MNKKRIFGIVAVIIIGLVAFAFANPLNDNNDNDLVNSVEELTLEKEKAVSDLSSYVSKANYSDANWLLVEKIITDGTNLINDAVTQDEINKVLEDSKLLIDKIDTLAVELGAVKINAINELNNYVLQANYSVNNFVLVQDEITKGIAAINAVTTIENVVVELNNAKALIDLISTLEEDLEQAKNNAKALIDLISTLEEDLEQAKNNAINELNNYVLQANYSVNNFVLIQDEITKGIAAINAVTTIENVAVELNNAKALIDLISTLEEDLEQAKINAINEIKNHIKDLSLYRNNEIEEINSIIEKGILDINSLNKIEFIQETLKTIKESLNKIKTNEMLLAEELDNTKNNAINELNNYVLQANYSVNNFALIQDEITKGIAAINAVTTIENVVVELNNAKALIDLISTLEEDLKQAKNNAINEIKTYIIDLNLYYENEQNAINKTLEDGIIEINSIDKIENMNFTLDNIKKLLDLIFTKIEIDIKNQALLDLNNYNADVYYLNETKLKVDNIKNLGKININKAEDLKSLEESLMETKKEIDSLTTIYTVILKDRNITIKTIRVEKGIETKKLEIPEIENKTYTEKGITYNSTNWNLPLTIQENTTINLSYEITKITAVVYIAKPEDSIYNVLTSGGFNNKLNSFNYYKITTIELNINDELKNIISKNKKVKSITTDNITSYIKENLPILALTNIDNSEYYKYVWNVLKFENGDGFHIDGSIIFDQEKYNYDNELKSVTATTNKNTFELSKTTIDDIKNHLVVSAIDNKDRSKVVTNYEVVGFDTTSLGNKTLSIDYTDNGITKTFNINYIVDDTTNPLVNLIGLDNIILTRKLGWSGYYVDYKEQGVNIDDLTKTITTTKIEFSKPYSNTKTLVNNIGGEIGTYIITYKVEDVKLNKTEVTRTIKVKRSYDSSEDIMFSDFSNSRLEVCKNCSFVDDKNVTAVDMFDGISFHSQALNVTADYSNVNMTKLGTYIATYTATDWLGASKTVSREIRVVDTTKPVIKLNGKTRTIVVEGTSVNIPDVSATDNYDQNLEDVEYTVKTYKKYLFIGATYLASVTYEVNDSSGNKATYYVEIDPDIKVKN